MSKGNVIPRKGMNKTVGTIKHASLRSLRGHTYAFFGLFWL